MLKEMCIKLDVRKEKKTLVHTVKVFIKLPVISNTKKKHFTLENNTYSQRRSIITQKTNSNFKLQLIYTCACQCPP